MIAFAKIGRKHRKHPERTLKSYIEMNERESIGDLAGQLNIEIEETYSPPDPGFWQTSQIDSDDDEIVDFDVAPKEKPFPRCPYIDFEAEEEPPSKKQRLSSRR